MLPAPLRSPEAVLVTGVDGPLARAVARRLSATPASLVLAAPDLRCALAAKEEVDRLRALLGSAAPAFAVAADPGSSGGAAAAIGAARDAAGPLAFVVVCAPLRHRDGAASSDGGPFRPMLEAVAALPGGARPCGIVLAAHALPPLDDHDARLALDSLARAEACGPGGVTVHVVTVADPHTSAAARAFGLMDRPFGADVVRATRRLDAAADTVRALVVGLPLAA